MVIIKLTAATICFLGQCYPVLVGKDTPIGQFQLIERITEQPGYGGDVLQFLEDKHHLYAIHRVFLLNTKQNRLERLNSNNTSDRFITSGCVNVSFEVYDKLKECCSNMTLIIEK